MRIRPEYSHLIAGSKVGVGVQGPTDLTRMLMCADRVLVLDHDLEAYAPTLRDRCWLRVMHDSNGWKHPFEHARAIAPVIVKARSYGIRDVLTENEKIALEGLGDSAEDYRWYNGWLCEFLPYLRGYLEALGAPDVRLWGPALSPGHQEDDGFQGYRLLADGLRLFDGIAVHNYWLPNSGFNGTTDFLWWGGRIMLAHDLIENELGIVKPWAITEFNRKVDRGSAEDIAWNARECKNYYAWINSLDYVVAAFTFLYTNLDPAFDDLTWVKMPGMVEAMSEGWEEPEPPPKPVGPEFKMGFAEYVNGHNLPWVPLEDERPDFDGNAYQRFHDKGTGCDGMLYYRRCENQVSHYWRG